MAENNHPLAMWRERQEPRVTQESLAEDLKVWPLTIWRWENGKRTPRRKVAERISTRTGLSIGELMAGKPQ